jgi:formate-dependent nitrite reductase membrane component NrfD
MFREVPIGWGWEVYVEMFLAGIAAGAYLTAMILEWMGRGRSPVARAAHVIALPLVLAATFLLVYKLERSERFWHMVIQSHNIPAPMGKWWSPISAGSWGLMAFSMFATVSFLDALLSHRWFRFGPWRDGISLHGSLLGKIFAIGGALSALFVGAYSGALISVTAVPGWVDSTLFSPFFLAISAATGAAALLLIDAVLRRAPTDEIDGLEHFSMLMVGWQLILLVILIITLGGAVTFFLTSFRTTVAAALAIPFAVAALVLLFLRGRRPSRLYHGLVGVLVLASGFLLRYVSVMGPQHAIE